MRLKACICYILNDHGIVNGTFASSSDVKSRNTRLLVCAKYNEKMKD